MAIIDRALGRDTTQHSNDELRDADPDALPLDRERPDDLATATFAMGCFWTPDALFGAQDGVWRTRSGYAGGDSPAPSYHDLGGHTESVQVDFDPATISYADLLDLFREGHAPSQRSRQYRSVVFVHDAEQRGAVEGAVPDAAAVEELDAFHPAENYHQKYRLRSSGAVLDALMDVYDPVDLVSSTVAARCNGIVGGFRAPDAIPDALGLDGDAMEALRAAAEQRFPANPRVC